MTNKDLSSLMIFLFPTANPYCVCVDLISLFTGMNCQSVMFKGLVLHDLHSPSQSQLKLTQRQLIKAGFFNVSFSVTERQRRRPFIGKSKFPERCTIV